jgi:hypothetical protein
LIKLGGEKVKKLLREKIYVAFPGYIPASDYSTCRLKAATFICGSTQAALRIFRLWFGWSI